MPTDPTIWRPEWRLPPGVKVAVSTRQGGLSKAPWDSLNLGDHVGDDPAAVAANRAILKRALVLPAEPYWLRQVHGRMIAGDEGPVADPPEADGAVTRRAGRVLAVLSADCLPVLACSRDGQVLGAFHAGWRGLAAGILDAGIAAMGVAPEEILVYFGPAIGPRQFVVGPELRERFVADDPGADAAFIPGAGDRFLADLYALARRRLQGLGVKAISGGEHCTVEAPQQFFSYRRDGQTGRMASLIWREEGR